MKTHARHKFAVALDGGFPTASFVPVIADLEVPAGYSVKVVRTQRIGDTVALRIRVSRDINSITPQEGNTA